MSINNLVMGTMVSVLLYDRQKLSYVYTLNPVIYVYVRMEPISLRRTFLILSVCFTIGQRASSSIMKT